MKKLLLSTLLVLSFGSVVAKSLVITLTNGRKVYYLLDSSGVKNPVMRFEGNNVVVDADTYTFYDIREFRISMDDDPAGIEEVVAARPSMKLNGQSLYVETADPVVVFSANGQKVSAPSVVSDGLQMVDVSALPKGVYVVKAGDMSFKFLKK